MMLVCTKSVLIENSGERADEVALNTHLSGLGIGESPRPLSGSSSSSGRSTWLERLPVIRSLPVSSQYFSPQDSGRMWKTWRCFRRKSQHYWSNCQIYEKVRGLSLEENEVRPRFLVAFRWNTESNWLLPWGKKEVPRALTKTLIFIFNV